MAKHSNKKLTPKDFEKQAHLLRAKKAALLQLVRERGMPKARRFRSAFEERFPRLSSALESAYIALVLLIGLGCLAGGLFLLISVSGIGFGIILLVLSPFILYAVKVFRELASEYKGVNAQIKDTIGNLWLSQPRFRIPLIKSLDRARVRIAGRAI